MRLISAHNSQWDVHFAGKSGSALKGNAALRAHVARAAGIELAQRVGQYVIHFSLGHAVIFYDSINAQRLIPKLVADLANLKRSQPAPRIVLALALVLPAWAAALLELEPPRVCQRSAV